MKQRVITIIIAALIFIPLLLLGGSWFNALVILMGLVAMSEVLRMKKRLLISPEAIISFLAVLVMLLPSSVLDFLPDTFSTSGVFYFLILCLLVYTVFSKNRFSFDDAGALTLGALYLGKGFSYMMDARSESLAMVLYALFIVWITDSGAYLIGRQIGKNKLAPNVSPNKTWEGSIGGTVSAVVLLAIYLYFFPAVQQGYSFVSMLGLTLIFSVGGQLGDLVESALKRYYGVKDSGNILPGHGGIFDRFDSSLIVLPLMHFAGLF